MKNSGKFILFAFLAIANLGIISCKKQPAATVVDPQAEIIAKAKADLRALLNDTGKSIEQKESELAAIKALNLTDPEVLSLIAQVEEKIAAEKAEALRLEEERKRREAELARANAPENLLKNFFGQISNAPSQAAADANINQALNMFTSPDAPVLTIISMAGNQPDYDRPTTIQKYLEYLKDQKKPADTIENIVFDDNGKIKELELTKLK